MVGIMPLLRRSDANSRSNVRPATGVPDHRAANSEKEATMTKQANDFRGRIFSREDIFAGRYFRVNSISNSLFAKFSSRENKVLYSSTCHGRPPLVQRKSGPSWQVAPRDRERTYAPLCQIKHTHQTH